MKHLSRFVKFLNESEEWNNEDLEDFLIAFKDMGLQVRVDDKKTILSGQYEGREMTSIKIYLSTLDKVKIGNSTGLNYGTIYDDKIWDILIEVVTLKNRLESDKVFLYLTTAEIEISYLHGQADTNTLEFKLEKLKSEIDSKHRRVKSDFANGIVVEVKDDAVVVNCSMFYTRRKWNSLTKDIDFSNWNLDFKEVKGNIYDGCIITITPKN